jgi:hypothetical protein
MKNLKFTTSHKQNYCWSVWNMLHFGFPCYVVYAALHFQTQLYWSEYTEIKYVKTVVKGS